MPAKERVGTVVSNKMEKTIVVAVESRYKSPIYSKVKLRTKRYLAHDEFNECNIGDQVLVQERRPYSRRKRWVLIKVINKESFSN
uniref:ribosomal protein S17 n=1 Tax=Chattonella marina TaxID=90936 RepID=UPI00211513E5|nr:ribosomal protein S17 [Chattonella marina]UTE94782.1 ribosomal protein S17 [Chattonella marina]